MNTATGLAFADKPQPVSSPSDWSLAQRIAFRFTFSYIGLYFYTQPLGLIPGMSILTSAFGRAIEDANWWLGKNVFKLRSEFLVTQSNDAALEYVRLCATIVLAGAVTIAWSLLDRRRSHYRGLHHGLRLYVRYTLAATMVGYGMAKVFPVQFPPPLLERMVEPYGESSPMALLWTFMGYSRLYSFFGGCR